MKKENNKKIFGIGLSKTGTTSLTEALNNLGYKAKHFPSVRYIPFITWHIKERYLIKYNALTDITVTAFYKELDKRFPGSKFILTVRDIDDWLESCRDYYRYKKPIITLPPKIIKLRLQIYGSIKFNKEKFEKAYYDHIKDVKDYFKERKEDLLVLNLCKNPNWKNLCDFLDKPIPDVPFPHRNIKGIWK